MEQQISHFKILEEIGSGGMGVVYSARDQRLHRKVALKILPAGALAESTIRERLKREAQTTSALNHPHIVTVFEIHTSGDRDFIAMELVEGRSLDQVIGEEGLPLEQALRYAIQIADALACAHEHGVIHRDLKPQNVMITPNDEVKILDFGLAKRFLSATVASDSSIEPGLMTLTAPGVKVGTPAYMSPEQIESRAIDARCDVFSFGCLLYQMLTGVNPFQRRNAILTFKAVLSEHPESLRSLKSQLPAELERVMSRAMAKAAEDRHQNMRDVLAELERVHAQLFGTAAYPIPPGRIAKPAPSKVGPALLMVALALAAAGLWRLASRAPSPPRLDLHHPLASPLGAQSQASFSPEGDRIVFVGEDSSGSSAIWTRSLSGGPPTRVTSVDFAVEHLGWSARDGGRVIFGRRGGGVWSVALAAGSLPRPLLEHATNPRLSPDGSRLVVELDGKIWTGAAGDDPAPVPSIPQAYFARWVARSPALSPDGRQVAYFQPEVGSVGDFWVAAVPGGKPRRLLGKALRGGDPIWTPDGKWILFWGDLAGEINLWCVAAGGGEPKRLTYGAGSQTGPAISADGRRIVYSAASPSYVLVRRGTESGDERRLIRSRHAIVRPAVSPAGNLLAFHAPDGPDLHLFVMAAEGGGVVQVTAEAGESNVLPRWSADGSHLFYYQDRPTRSLRKVPAAGGKATIVLRDWSRYARYDTAVDPAEERVLYTPIEAGMPRRLRVRELDSGREWELGAILLAASWSADGSEVLGSDAEDRIYLCPASGGDCRFLAEGFAPRWSPQAGSITFARRAGSTPRDRIQSLAIWTLAIESLEGRQLAEVDAVDALSFGYALLPGGDLIWNRLLPGDEERWVADLM